MGVVPQADHVSCHLGSPSDALPCSAWGPNDSYLVLSTLFPLLGRWGRVVLSQCNGGGAIKAELYAWSTVSMVVAPGWASLAFFVKMEKVRPGDPRVTWVPGWSDEHSADNTASASCLALWDRNLPIFLVKIVLPVWNGVFFPMFLLTKVSYQIVLYSVESCEIANIWLFWPIKMANLLLFHHLTNKNGKFGWFNLIILLTLGKPNIWGPMV